MESIFKCLPSEKNGLVQRVFCIINTFYKRWDESGIVSGEDTFQKKKKRAKNLIKIDKQWEKDLWTTKAESEKNK